MEIYRQFDRVSQALEEANIRYAVVGGLAVAFHGFLRATKDIDFLLHRDDVERVLEIMKDLGFLQSNDPWTFKNTELTLWRFIKATELEDELVIVDMLVAHRGEHLKMIADAVDRPILDRTVKLVGRDDLRKLKMARGSAQDLADIARMDEDATDPQSED